MTQTEYEKAKQECKKDLRNKLMLGNLQGDLFSATFDRAYALGKQQKTIAQEDIEKTAEAFATPPIGNGGMFTRQQVKELLVKFAQLFPGKQEKDADAVIQGWVAIDEAYGQCFLHTEKPIQKAQPIADTGDYDTVWDSDGKTYLIDVGLFPDMDSDSDPEEVEIIIKRKKNG